MRRSSTRSSVVRALSLPPLFARIDEGPKSDFRDEARLAACDLAKELRYAAERKVVRFDSAFSRHAGELRHKTEMPTDNAPNEALVREPVQSFFSPVSGRSRKNEGQIAWSAGIEKRCVRARI